MKKEKYKQINEDFLKAKSREEGVQNLRGRVLYKIIQEGKGEGTVSPAVS